MLGTDRIQGYFVKPKYIQDPVVLIDTPGFKPNQPNTGLKQSLQKFMRGTNINLQAICLVIDAQSTTSLNCLQEFIGTTFTEVFGDKLKKNVIAVFTKARLNQM